MSFPVPITPLLNPPVINMKKVLLNKDSVIKEYDLAVFTLPWYIFHIQKLKTWALQNQYLNCYPTFNLHFNKTLILLKIPYRVN